LRTEIPVQFLLSAVTDKQIVIIHYCQ